MGRGGREWKGGGDQTRFVCMSAMVETDEESVILITVAERIAQMSDEKNVDSLFTDHNRVQVLFYTRVLYLIIIVTTIIIRILISAFILLFQNEFSTLTVTAHGLNCHTTGRPAIYTCCIVISSSVGRR